MLYLFQFTPLREGRLAAEAATVRPYYFNSRPSARGDADSLGHSERIAYFNSRPSARGDDRFARPSAISRRFQFTPLREGRQADAQSVQESADISIHAPPRGATRLLRADLL